MEKKIISRKFIYDQSGDQIELPDPGADMDVKAVLRFYSGQYPELTNAKATGPVFEDDKHVYNISTEVGTKG